MAAGYKTWTVFAFSNTGIVCSNPTSRHGHLRLFCVCVVAVRWSPVHGGLLTADKIKSLKWKEEFRWCPAPQREQLEVRMSGEYCLQSIGPSLWTNTRSRAGHRHSPSKVVVVSLNSTRRDLKTSLSWLAYHCTLKTETVRSFEIPVNFYQKAHHIPEYTAAKAFELPAPHSSLPHFGPIRILEQCHIKVFRAL